MKLFIMISLILSSAFAMADSAYECKNEARKITVRIDNSRARMDYQGHPIEMKCELSILSPEDFKSALDYLAVNHRVAVHHACYGQNDQIRTRYLFGLTTLKDRLNQTKVAGIAMRLDKSDYLVNFECKKIK